MKAVLTKVGDIATRFINAGRGEPVVLLHGIGMSADCFHRNIEALATDRAVYALDMIGHGYTEYRGLAGLGPLDAMSRHVLDFMRSAGIESAHVVGSSLGGGVAINCHLMQPDAVRSCTIVGSSTPFVDARQLSTGLSMARENAAESLDTGSMDALRRRLRHLVFSESAVSEVLLAMQMSIYAQADRIIAYDDIVDGIKAACDDPRATPLARLDEVTIPVLVIAGKDDPRSPLEAIRTGVELLRNGYLTVYDNCGHFPFLEYPTQFNAELNAFLDMSEHDRLALETAVSGLHGARNQ